MAGARAPDGRGFSRTPALAYCRSGNDAARFKAPSDEYLKSRQANISRYWDLGSMLPICKLNRKLVYTWEGKHGTGKFENEDELKQLFLFIGKQRRWRLPIDADRAVQKLHALGLTEVKAVQSAAKQVRPQPRPPPRGRRRAAAATLSH